MRRGSTLSMGGGARGTAARDAALDDDGGDGRLLLPSLIVNLWEGSDSASVVLVDLAVRGFNDIRYVDASARTLLQRRIEKHVRRHRFIEKEERNVSADTGRSRGPSGGFIVIRVMQEILCLRPERRIERVMPDRYKTPPMQRMGQTNCKSRYDARPAAQR